MRYIVSFIAFPVLIYMAAVFICLEPNVFAWTDAGRLMLLVLQSFSAVMCFTCPAWRLK